jgi:UDP-N-acetylglucosamine 2-epimerase
MTNAVILTDVEDPKNTIAPESTSMIICLQCDSTEDNIQNINTVVDIQASEDIVTDDDFDTMREWLSYLESYDGISLGLLVHSKFIHLYGHQLFWQFRQISRLLDKLEPNELKVVTEGRTVYDFFEKGSNKIETGVVAALCQARGIRLKIKQISQLPPAKDWLFRRFAPTGLLTVEHATESYVRARDRNRPTANRIIFFLANAHNLSRIRPVISKIGDSGYNPLVIIQSPGFFNYDTNKLNKLRDIANVRSFESYQSRDIYKTMREERSRLGNAWSSIDMNRSFQNKFTIDTQPAWEAVKDRFWLYYTVQFPRIIKYIETCRRIFETERPEAIILKGDGPSSTRTFVRVAKDHQVPSLLIQHGRTPSGRRLVSITDHVATWGEYSSEFFKTQGYSDSDITVTGAPHLDELSTHNVDRDAILSSLGLDPDDAIVTLASQPFNNSDRTELVGSVSQSISSFDNVSVILRPHQREERTLHKETAARLGSRAVVAAEEPIFDILASSDLVIGTHSTVLLEASLLETPVLTINYLTEKPDNFYTRHFHTVSNKSDLHEEMRRILFVSESPYMGNQPQLGREFAHNEDGKANARIVELIEDLINEYEHYPRGI